MNEEKTPSDKRLANYVKHLLEKRHIRPGDFRIALGKGDKKSPLYHDVNDNSQFHRILYGERPSVNPQLLLNTMKEVLVTTPEENQELDSLFEALKVYQIDQRKTEEDWRVNYEFLVRLLNQLWQAIMRDEIANKERLIVLIKRQVDKLYRIKL
jgi:hypothetical protein